MTKQRKLPGIQLRVAEAKLKDVGKSRARLDIQTIEGLEISAGDVIEVTGGKKSTVAVAVPIDPEEGFLGVVRIDGLTRKNAGAVMNENALIRKIECAIAKSVSLTPIGTKGSMDKEFAEFVRNRLTGTPLIVGDELFGNCTWEALSRSKSRKSGRRDVSRSSVQHCNNPSRSCPQQEENSGSRPTKKLAGWTKKSGDCEKSSKCRCGTRRYSRSSESNRQTVFCFTAHPAAGRRFWQELLRTNVKQIFSR